MTRSAQLVRGPLSGKILRGEALAPIHKAAPAAAAQDETLYRALALVDAIRAGKTREKEIASNLLKEIIGGGR